MVYEEMISLIQEALGTALRRVAPSLSEEAARRRVFSIVGQLLHVTFYMRLIADTDGDAATERDIRLILKRFIRFSRGGILSCEGEGG